MYAVRPIPGCQVLVPEGTIPGTAFLFSRWLYSGPKKRETQVYLVRFRPMRDRQEPGDMTPGRDEAGKFSSQPGRAAYI